MGIANWTTDRIEKLRKLWSEGLTTKRIAEELGHVTRNAVIGKATRLGLAGTRRSGPQKQGKPISVKPAGRTVGVQVQAINRKRKPVAPVVAEEAFTPRTVNLPSHRKTIFDLKAMECRWPDGERNEDGLHTFCGCRTADGSSYCPAHAELSKGQGTASERNAPGLLRRAAA